jgi:hypothetical protein
LAIWASFHIPILAHPFGHSQLPKSSRFFEREGKIGSMNDSKQVGTNVLLSCGVIMLVAALAVSLLFIIGLVLAVV